MIKKIQQYLLLNYPILWNTKIVPILLGTIIANILFFLIGYFFTSVDFNSGYNYFEVFTDNGLVYFGAIVSALLLFIIWLVFYSKNNSFKVFYPRKASSLYLEWLLSFIIIFSMTLFPYSYQKGTVYKARSYVTKTEMIKAIETLNMVKILIPSYKNSYFQEYPTEVHQQNARMSLKGGNTQPYIDQAYIDSVTNSTASHNVYYEDYPNFTQLSLLNYSNSYEEIYISDQYKFQINGTQKVKEWLIAQEKQNISDLMDAFLKLQEKHKLKTNLSKDQWMNLIYNPAKYPVGDFNLISPYEQGNNYDYYSYDDSNPNGYYLPYYGLKSGYEKIMKAYMDDEVQEAFILVSICFALGISLLVFSFRSTSGKSWLIAFVSIGLILFINGILSVSADSLIYTSFSSKIGLVFYMFVLLILFFCEIISVIIKNNNKKKKGRSDIYINHLIWFIPTVPMLIFFIVYIFAEGRCDYNTEYERVNCETYTFMRDNMVAFLWGNICLTFISMWFFIQLILRKWKGLPEE